MRCFLRAKLHNARVTATDRDYMGSISLGPELLRLADIAPFERVDVYNVDNGERLTTYAIEGEPGQVCLNGAAAHRAEPGQRVIVAAYAWLDDEQARAHRPRVVILGQGNEPVPAQ